MSVVAEPTVLTPTLRVTARRGAFWVAVFVFALVVALITVGLAGAASDANRLSASNNSPQGAKALAEVLRQNGVTVTETASLAASRGAAGDATSTTLLFYDQDSLLSPFQLKQLGAIADNLILLEPGFRTLEALAPDILLAGEVQGDLAADCELGAVQRAGTVSRGGQGYRFLGETDAATLCLGSGNDTWSLIQTTVGDTQVTALGTTDALTNQHIIDEGNAALALGLLGETDTLIWYLPSFDDFLEGYDSPPTFAELSPSWVLPLTTLIALVALAAAIWRGRRFGPLVVENLPVIVRASETMEGRARLYQRSSARLRALDALRIGTIDRLATLCGLPRLATVDEVIAAVSSLTARPLHDVRALLLELQPDTDTDLVRLSDELLELERHAAAAVRSA